MKIKIAEFWLCESGTLAPDGLRVGVRRVIQPAEFLRAESAKPFNRQNTLTTVSFTVNREHVDIKTAEAFMLKHELEIPAAGICTFICENEDGTQKTYYLADGTLETTEASQIGVATLHSYTLLGGRFTTVKPV